MSSAWNRYKPKEYPQLAGDTHAEAVIVGGGIAGSTALYLLAKKGVKAVLIEKTKLSESATAYTTAFITHVVDTGLVELKEMFDEKTAKAVWNSHKDAIDTIEANVQAEKIDCEFKRTDNYIFANDEKEWEGIEKEAKLANEYGFQVDARKDYDLPLENFGYAIVKNQAKFHPTKYVDALRGAAVTNSAQIFEGTEATAISEEDGKVIVATTNGRITADKALISTYDPFNKPSELFAHKGIYTTYILELAIPNGTLPEGIYEDEENPYHYFRIDENTEDPEHEHTARCLLGGRDHRHEIPLDPEKAYRELEEYIKRKLPATEYRIIDKWSGPIIETIDGLAFIGTYDDKSPNIFVATGFSGNGMTYGTIAGSMFYDFCVGKASRWINTYNPNRKHPATALWQKGKDYIEEFARGYGRSVFKDPKHDAPE